MARELYYGCSEDGYLGIVCSMNLQGDWDQIFVGHAKVMNDADSSKAILTPSVCNCGEGDGCC